MIVCALCSVQYVCVQCNEISNLDNRNTVSSNERLAKLMVLVTIEVKPQTIYEYIVALHGIANK